jgi:hypothetical protein
VTVGPVAAVTIAQRPGPKKEDYDHQSEYRNIETSVMTCEQGSVCENGNRGQVPDSK